MAAQSNVIQLFPHRGGLVVRRPAHALTVYLDEITQAKRRHQRLAAFCATSALALLTLLHVLGT